MDIKKIIKQEQENTIIRLVNAMGYTKGSQISQTRFISDSTYKCSRGYEYKVVTIFRFNVKRSHLYDNNTRFMDHLSPGCEFYL